MEYDEIQGLWKCSIVIKGQTDHWDHDAFDKDYERLVQVGRIDVEDNEEHPDNYRDPDPYLGQ